jgi:hypothetical protein
VFGFSAHQRYAVVHPRFIDQGIELVPAVICMTRFRNCIRSKKRALSSGSLWWSNCAFLIAASMLGGTCPRR